MGQTYLYHWLARPIFENETETKTGDHMSLVNETETETFHTLVVPARPRPRFIGPWSESKTVSDSRPRPRLQFI